MRYLLSSILVAAMVSPAAAHISISSGPAQATKSSIITFGVGHGCTDTAMKHIDTVKVRIEIPAGVTSVRAIPGDLGQPKLIKNGATVTHVEFTKPVADLIDGDDNYYEVKIRARIPDAPFTRLQWNVEQTCEDAVTHAQIVVNWDQPPGSMTGEPAAMLTIVPTRVPGWNKYVLKTAMLATDLPLYLGDALIAWKGSAAYSGNSNTAALIDATPGVTKLAADLAVDDEIWVKY
jgi:uncharacterized protein YcnI